MRRNTYRVFDSDARLLVAFSGGQDSATLLHALHRARRSQQLLAAHVDHGLRADSGPSPARPSLWRARSA